MPKTKVQSWPLQRRIQKLICQPPSSLVFLSSFVYIFVYISLSIMFATVRRQNQFSRSPSRTRKRKMGRRKREIWFCHWTGRRWKLISCSPSGSLRTGRLLLCFALADVDEVLSKSGGNSVNTIWQGIIMQNSFENHENENGDFLKKLWEVDFYL